MPYSRWLRFSFRDQRIKSNAKTGGATCWPRATTRKRGRLHGAGQHRQCRAVDREERSCCYRPYLPYRTRPEGLRLLPATRPPPSECQYFNQRQSRWPRPDRLGWLRGPGCDARRVGGPAPRVLSLQTCECM